MEKLKNDHYEQAFQSWMIDYDIKFSPLDQHKRTAFKNSSIKSFDFLVYPHRKKPAIVEVKGRKFTGRSLKNLTSLQSWVTTEDVRGLSIWQSVFGFDYDFFFLFAYFFQNIDVDNDGRDTYEFNSNQYLFLLIKLDDYCKFMKTRSPKWKTIDLPAEKFRSSIIQPNFWIN